MNYELAKELKDAGFSQCGKGEFIGVSGGLIDHSGDVYVPTLEEIIEACGHGIWNLTKTNEAVTYWHASNGLRDRECKYGYGTTPEEAVANLWLALSKK
jgi:hypothetical protein